MNIIKDTRTNPELLILRLFCVVVYACMFSSASSVHADMRYLEETYDLDGNTLNAEFIESTLEQSNFDVENQDHTTHCSLPPETLIPSFSRTIDKPYLLALEAHFDQCFAFVSADKERLFSYLQYRSVIPRSR